MLDSEFAQEQQQQDPMTAAKEKRISNGTKFLLDSRVAQSALGRKIGFLKSKGLSAEEIAECFQRANQPQTIETITRFMQEQAPAQPQPTARLANSPPPLPAQQQQQQQLMYPQAPLPAAPPQSSWKDALMRAGMLAVGAYAAFHAFQTYSPYEIRHKDEAMGPSSSSLSATGRRRSRWPNDAGPQVEASRAAPAAPLPPQPTAAENTAPPASGDGSSSSSPATQQLQERISTLEADLAAANAKYEKEKKDKAELAFVQSRLKSQLQQVMRTSEKNAAEVTRLNAELHALRDLPGAPSVSVGPVEPSQDIALDGGAAGPTEMILPHPPPPEGTEGIAAVAEPPVANA